MRARFKFPLTFIGFLIAGCIIVFACYYLYNEISSGASIVVEGNLSINYLSDTYLSKENNTDIKFSVTNAGTTIDSYYIEFVGVENNSEITYTLTSNNNVDIEGTVKSEKIIDKINIEPGVTHDYILNVNPSKSEYFNAELVVKKYVEITNFFAGTILNDNEIKEIPLTEVAKNISTLDEGLIKVETNGSNSYYFRGNVSNNYVSFANLTWRIVKINSDNSIKLVLNENLSTISSYYASDSQYGFKGSTSESLLNTWYDSNLTPYSDTISTHNFCNDNSKVNETTLAAYNRANIDLIATYSCLGEEVNSKIGMLTVDEVLYAGHTTASNNKSTYLINENIDDNFYLMSGAKITSSYYPFVLNTSGKIIDDEAGTYLRGIRPVINITSGVNVTGDGTKDNPYTIKTNE